MQRCQLRKSQALLLFFFFLSALFPLPVPSLVPKYYCRQTKDRTNGIQIKTSSKRTTRKVDRIGSSFSGENVFCCSRVQWVQWCWSLVFGQGVTGSLTQFGFWTSARPPGRSGGGCGLCVRHLGEARWHSMSPEPRK